VSGEVTPEMELKARLAVALGALRKGLQYLLDALSGQGLGAVMLPEAWEYISAAERMLSRLLE